MITLDNVINIYESGNVVRFHTCPSNGPRQTIADHSWGVAIFASCIDPKISMIAILHALTHDAAEKCLGDIPAHGKWTNPEYAFAYSQAEERVERILGIHCELTQSEKEVIKLADMIELAAHSCHQWYMGNTYYNEIIHRCIDWFHKNEAMVQRWPNAEKLIDMIIANNDTRKP